MQFTVRVDDIGWIQNRIADRGLLLAQRFHASMRGLPYLAAVIPEVVDHDGLVWLRSKPEGMTIALHGFDHHPTGNGVASEFHECDLDACRQRIAWGLNSLKGIEVRHMVLPFNAYAPPLSEACYLTGIMYIWGGGLHDVTVPSAWLTPPQPYSLGRVGFVPSWAPTYAATLWRMGADDIPLRETLPRILDLPGRAVLTLHITWEAAKSDDFRGVNWLVEQIRDRVISAQEYLA
jgi:peptidoglycan/xylan/chitin deacetylase (PgdA/CDA1 family)